MLLQILAIACAGLFLGAAFREVRARRGPGTDPDADAKPRAAAPPTSAGNSAESESVEGDGGEP